MRTIGVGRTLAVCFATSALLACSDPKVRQEPGFEVAFDASDMWLLNAWGPEGSDQVYAVGGSEDEGLAMHYDGESWQRVDFGVNVPLLTWAWGFSDDEITMVGNEGTVLHYDGSEWTVQSTPTDQNL